MIERFRDLIAEEDLEMLEIYMYNEKDVWEWVKYAVEDAEDELMVEEVIKSIYEQIGEEEEEYIESIDNNYYYGLSKAQRVLSDEELKKRSEFGKSMLGLL